MSLNHKYISECQYVVNIMTETEVKMLGVRANQQERHLLQKASDIDRRSRAQFVLKAALEKAQEVLDNDTE